MGYYVNPISGQTKEGYLAAVGTEVTKDVVENFVFGDNVFPVFLVDNGIFSAAAVAYNEGERDYFLGDGDDGRPMKFFLVPREHLGEAAGLGDTLDKY